MSEQLNRIEKYVERISATIHGNGQPGLKTTVAQHSQTLAVIKRIIWGIAGAIGTLATAYAATLLL